jgi:hypothetical protein
MNEYFGVTVIEVAYFVETFAFIKVIVLEI